MSEGEAAAAGADEHEATAVPAGGTAGPNRFVALKYVRFGQCDPAGIIYYPRYFELCHEAKEDWFRAALGAPFEALVGEHGGGFPVVRLEAQFSAPSRLGDLLEIAVSVGRIGRSSLELDYECTCGGEARMRMQTVVVHTRLSEHASEPIPDPLRRRLERFVAGER